eukprot:3890649-Pyramimonas_sp.AAC.1
MGYLRAGRLDRNDVLPKVTLASLIIQHGRDDHLLPFYSIRASRVLLFQRGEKRLGGSEVQSFRGFRGRVGGRPHKRGRAITFAPNNRGYSC